MESVLLVKDVVGPPGVEEDQHDEDRKRQLAREVVTERKTSEDADLIQRLRERRMQVPSREPDHEQDSDHAKVLSPIRVKPLVSAHPRVSRIGSRHLSPSFRYAVSPVAGIAVFRDFRRASSTRVRGYSSLPVAEAVRIDSTTVASARVVVSPNDCPFAMSRSKRRMILPDRVLGSSGVNMIVFGRAIEPILPTTCSRSSFERPSPASLPPRSVTKAKIAWVVTGSSRPMTAASATAGCDTSADSTSVVEMRWPEIFMTSSTRPISQK